MIYAVPVRAGLGATQSSNVWGAFAVGGASSAVIAAQGGNSSQAIGGGLLAAAPFTGPAAPFLAAGGAAVTAFSSLFKGCGDTCVMATKAADAAAAATEEVVSQYWAIPTPRPKSAQRATLAMLDEIAAVLYQQCSRPELADAGRRCISERLIEGGTAPWCPTPDHTGCDWITVHYRPIENDPNTFEDDAGEKVSEAIQTVFTTGPDGSLNWGAIGAVSGIAAGVFLL